MTKPLNAKSFGLAAGILFGVLLFFTTLVSLYTGYATGFLNVLESIYPGYSISVIGAFVGLLYGFFDGLIGCFVFIKLYNFLLEKV